MLIRIRAREGIVRKRKCKRCRILLKRIKTQADNARVRNDRLMEKESHADYMSDKLHDMQDEVEELYFKWGFWRRLKYLFTARR